MVPAIALAAMMAVTCFKNVTAAFCAFSERVHEISDGFNQTHESWFLSHLEITMTANSAARIANIEPPLNPEEIGT